MWVGQGGAGAFRYTSRVCQAKSVFCLMPYATPPCPTWWGVNPWTCRHKLSTSPNCTKLGPVLVHRWSCVSHHRTTEGVVRATQPPYPLLACRNFPLLLTAPALPWGVIHIWPSYFSRGGGVHALLCPALECRIAYLLHSDRSFCEESAAPLEQHTAPCNGFPTPPRGAHSGGSVGGLAGRNPTASVIALAVHFGSPVLPLCRPSGGPSPWGKGLHASRRNA